MTPRGRSSEPSISEVVAQLDLDELRELVVSAAESHADVDRMLRFAMSRSEADLAGLRLAVDAALRTRRFLDRRESSGWAGDAAPLVDELCEWAAERPSRELVVLIERAAGHVVKVILHADDRAPSG